MAQKLPTLVLKNLYKYIRLTVEARIYHCHVLQYHLISSQECIFLQIRGSHYGENDFILVFGALLCL